MDGLAQRWGCPPSVVLREPSWVLRMVAIIDAGTPEDEGGGDQQWP